MPSSIAGQYNWRFAIMELRILSRVFVFLVGVFLATGTSAAPGLYSATGEGRTFNGFALVFPIPGPATGSGLVKQDPVLNGGKGTLTLSAAYPVINRVAPSPNEKIGLWQFGGKDVNDVLSISTALDVQFPANGAGDIQLKADGRSGPPTLAFCPGATQPGKSVFSGTAAGFNPACTDPQAYSIGTGGGSGIANGIMTYTKTASQFGGLASLGVQGPVNLAIMFAKCLGDPYNCQTSPAQGGLFIKAISYLSGTGVGEPISAIPDPLQWQNVNLNRLSGYTFDGIVNSGPTLVPSAALVTNIAWSGGLTTGKLTLYVTNNAGPQDMDFKVEGYDNRTSLGLGAIQMVSGSVSQLTVNGGTPTGGASRSITTVTITPEPTMLLGAGVALVALVASHTLVRRRSSRS
jgi:hypothetical protein